MQISQSHLTCSFGPQVRTTFIGDSRRIQERIRIDQDARLLVDQRPTIENLLASSGTEPDPELILVWQSWSDRFSEHAVAELLRAFPLTRILNVYGSLGESDGRTRNVWPVALRVPCWKLPQRLEQELGILRCGQPALYSTASREEVARFEMAAAKNSSSAIYAGQELLIVSPDLVWAEMQREFWPGPTQILISIEQAAEIIENECGIHVLFDLDPLSSDVVPGIASAVQQLGPDHIYAASNWLTPQLTRQLQSRGVKHFYCKLTPAAAFVGSSQ